MLSTGSGRIGPVGGPGGARLGLTLPAFSDAHGSRELAGALLAVWSLGSAAGGLAFGAWTRRPPLQRVHIAVAALLPVALLPLALAPSVAVMGLLVTMFAVGQLSDSMTAYAIDGGISAAYVIADKDEATSA